TGTTSKLEYPASDLIAADPSVLMLRKLYVGSVAATSLCITAKAVRKCFREGVLPDHGTVCNIEDSMFLDQPRTLVTVLKEEESKL
ncbi:11351_t:CDS:2, partial [Acaulospora colombiana]